MGGRGRGGRGGGRFGGRGAANIDVTRDAAEDLGISGLSFTEGPPLLYPPIPLPPPANLTADEEYIISKSRDLIFRMRHSPYYLTNDLKTVEYEQSNDRRYTANRTSGVLESYLTESYPGSHIPRELVGNKKLGGGHGLDLISVIQTFTDPSTDSNALISLEEKEKSGKYGKNAVESKAEEEESGIESGADDLGDDIDDDYGQNYYASEQESNDGDEF